MESARNRKPSVSVIMPLYNKGDDVVRAVNSALRQTVRDFELIVINDGSTDNGPELVRQFSDPRIRIIDQENRGVSAARNKGIMESNAEIIAFLDADDEWEPGFLEAIFSLISRYPECSVFATGYVFREPDGTLSAPIINGLPENPWQGVLDDYFRIAAQSDPPLWTGAIAVKKETILSVGCFLEGVASGEDLLTWAKMAAKNEIAYDTRPQAMFWVPSSVKSRPARLKKNAEDIVGDELEALMEVVDENQKSSLSQYIALWHIMRASIFIELGWNDVSSIELKKSIQRAGYSVKLVLLLVMSRLPVVISKKIFFSIKKIKKYCI